MNNLAIDPIWIWIAVGVVVVLAIVMMLSRGAKKSRSAALREQYGTEYDHAVKNAGNRKRAEHDLITRAEEVKQYDIRPLSAADQTRFRGEWQRLEQRFIERPTTAVTEADELVAEIMRVQGYPMGDFEKHAAHLSVKHPRLVEHYRSGHKVLGGAPGSASTEDLRQALLHYRALFDELIGTSATADVARDIPRQNEVVTASSRDELDTPVVRDEERIR
ncbi:MAG TPA: hypothetical protein VGF48_03710 [Thermoanaerobaculia bacterium]|jgi:hypothetical protein